MSGTRATLRNVGTPLNAEVQKLRRYGQVTAYGQIPLNEDNAEATGPIDPVLFVGGFGSYHPGGVNAAFGDSSVQFLSANISPEVLKQLANRADGKLPSKDDRLLSLTGCCGRREIQSSARGGRAAVDRVPLSAVAQRHPRPNHRE